MLRPLTLAGFTTLTIATSNTDYMFNMPDNLSLATRQHLLTKSSSPYDFFTYSNTVATNPWSITYNGTTPRTYKINCDISMYR